MRAARATLAAALLAACAQPATEAVAATLAPAPMKLSPGQPADWAAREAAIEAELRELGPHPWAGVYRDGGGYEVATLKLAPRAGFLFSSWGCTGITGRNLGAVREQDGVLTLECAWPGGPHGFPERFTIVPWDDQVYLVGDLASFCSQVSAGQYPHALLREGAGRPSLASRPRVPAEFERWLLDEPLHARVTAVGAPEYLDDLELRGRRTRVTLDVGRAEGVYVGLCLVTRAGSDTLPAQLGVIELAEHTCVAEIVDHESPVRALPSVGAECATRWE